MQDIFKFTEEGLDANGKVAANSITFAPKDTIYAVVTTTSSGMANATVIERLG